MAHIQTVTLPTPWFSMQLLTVREPVQIDIETMCQHHLYLVDSTAENGPRHFSTKQGAAFPPEPAPVIEADE